MGPRPLCQQISNAKCHTPVADPGGGVQGVRPPPFGPRCRLFNIGPTVGPPLAPPFLLVDLRWTPVADPGCTCVWQGWSPPPPWNVDDVTRAMPKGGCLWMSKSGGVFQFFWGRMTSRGQCPRGGACEKSCIRAWTPPPSLYLVQGVYLVRSCPFNFFYLAIFVRCTKKKFIYYVINW